MNGVDLGWRDRGHRDVLGDLLFADLDETVDVVRVFRVRLQGDMAVEMITGSHVVGLFATAWGVENQGQFEVGSGVGRIICDRLLEGENGPCKILAGEAILATGEIGVVLMADAATARGVATRRKQDQ